MYGLGNHGVDSVQLNCWGLLPLLLPPLCIRLLCSHSYVPSWRAHSGMLTSHSSTLWAFYVMQWLALTKWHAKWHPCWLSATQ